jgi:hypothetical protein
MPSGTTVKIFAARLHKSNAKGASEDALVEIEYAIRKLVALACTSPPQTGVEVLDELIHEVEDVVDGLMDASFKQICSRSIIEFPEDCEDELDEPSCEECGQIGFHKFSCSSKGLDV